MLINSCIIYIFSCMTILRIIDLKNYNIINKIYDQNRFKCLLFSTRFSYYYQVLIFYHYINVENIYKLLTTEKIVLLYLLGPEEECITVQ